MSVDASVETSEDLTVDMTPTWEAAVQIYLMVLDNPSADSGVRRSAQEDLLRLGRAYDGLVAEYRSLKQV